MLFNLLNCIFTGAMQKQTILSKVLIWIIGNVGHRQLILSLSLIIGLVGGLAAVILKNTVHYTSEFLSGRLAVETNNLIYIAFPLFGILLPDMRMPVLRR